MCIKCKIWYNTSTKKQISNNNKNMKDEEEKMNTPYSAMNLSKYIIDFCYKNNCPVSNLKLQKMLYFLQVDSYQNNSTLLFDEGIYAWPYGPVVPEVYRRYSGYGGATIHNEYEIQNKEKYACLNEKILFLAQYDSWDLVGVSHKEDGPWDRVYKNGEGEGDLIRPDLFQYEEFKILA